MDKPSDSAASATKVSRKTETQKEGWRLPAAVIKQFIIQAVVSLLTTPAKLLALCGEVLDGYRQLDSWFERVKQIGQSLTNQPTTEQRALLLKLLCKVVIEVEQVTLHFSIQAIYQLGAGLEEGNKNITPQNSSDNNIASLVIPWHIRRRGVEMKLIINAENQNPSPNHDEALIRAIAKGHHWFDLLSSGRVKTIAEIARQNGIKGRWVSKLINLAFLAPDIVEHILNGTQQTHLTAKIVGSRKATDGLASAARITPRINSKIFLSK